MEKGLLNAKQEKVIAEIVIAVIPTFKRKWLNSVVNFIIRWGVKLLDNHLFEKMNPGWKTDIIPIIDKIIEKEYEEARMYVTDLLNKRIDVKGMDEPTELEAFDNATKTFLIWSRYFIEQKRKAA